MEKQREIYAEWLRIVAAFAVVFQHTVTSIWYDTPVSWTDYIGDAMMTSLMEGTEVDYQRSRQVVVFYDGEYFGIHDLRERLNRSFVETNYGIDSKSINMVKIKGSQLEASGTNGASYQEYQQLVNEINSGNYAGENNSSLPSMPAQRLLL